MKRNTKIGAVYKGNEQLKHKLWDLQGVSGKDTYWGTWGLKYMYQRTSLIVTHINSYSASP